MIRFIATRHDEYRQREFDPGDIVIDPWRYIPDQPGVKVHRIGENKPELISLLVPSRGRARPFGDLVRSAGATATHSRRIEIVSYHDEDDPDLDLYSNFALYPFYGHEPIIGQRILLSEAWNECYRRASGEILMHCGDDIRFITEGWDVIVREAFRSVPDRIVLVHGDDLSPNTDALATHGFIHRRWVDAVGYFLPPYFSCDWNDVWLTEVADEIGRRKKVPIVTDHLHYTFGRRERDQTDADREERGREDNVVELYKSKRRERLMDVAKLKEVMA
jgi:glycosyl transferase/beta-hydroxylase protein BlmF